MTEMADVYKSTLRLLRALKAERVENREMTVAKRGRATQASVSDFTYVLRPQFMGKKLRPGEVSQETRASCV